MLGRQMHAFAAGQRRKIAVTAVAKRGVGIALACRAFGVSESRYRYSPKLDGENEEIADLLIGLTNAWKAWGSCAFCICATPQGVSGITKGCVASTASSN